MPMNVKKPSKMPPAMMEAAEEAEGAFEGVIRAAEKPFDARVVGGLSKALAAAAKMFDIPVTVSTYDAPVEALDPDTVGVLMMIAEAAKDYGQPLPIAPEAVKSDNDLIAITSAVQALAKDPEFRMFLAGAEEEGAMEEEAEDTEEAEPFDFAGRMRR